MIRLPAGSARLVTAAVVAALAFALYRATLLPGFDFGDTGSFQTIVGLPLLTPRNGYPLYFAIGRTLVALAPASRADPAWLLNLASAIEGAAACGLLALVGAELAGSTAAGAAAALLFACSYTFWSQATIAEVYALHACFLTGSLLLLLRWSKQPTMTRLALFFAVFAIGFGNHLSMVLLLPGYTLFLLVAAPRGWRSLFAPRVVVLAIAIACLGAAQYLWNLRTLWLLPDAPRSLIDGLQTFWFDVTKSDWRDTMVLQVPRSMIAERFAMYGFDLRQQFGPFVPVLAVVGLLRLGLADWRRALLMFALYAANVAFAFGYEVGDSHVFYLPSHLIVALLAGSSIVLAGLVTRRGAAVCATALALYAGVRAYRDFPALDRSGDRRPEQVIAAMTSGIDDRHAILLTDLNWQIANGLSYFASVTRPDVVWWRLSDVMLYAPALVADNLAIDRDVALTERAHDELTAAYGPLLPIDRDARVATPTLTEIVRALPAGTRYVLCVLDPTPDAVLDRDDVANAARALTAGAAQIPAGAYAVLAGAAGQTPQFAVGSSGPFQQAVSVSGVNVEIRMESWLAFDTIRRMGFGQVVAARQHTLIVERGVSFAAFDDRGRPLQTAYRSNVFAPQARYLVRRAAQTP